MVLKHLLKTNKYPIGIDIGAYAVRMAQLSERGSGAVVTASYMHPLDPTLPLQGALRERAIAQAIEAGMSQGQFKGNNVVMSLPANAVIYKNIRIPIMPPNEIRQAVHWEATDRLHLSLDNVELQYLNVGEVRQGEEQKQEIIILAVKKQLIEQHVEVLSQNNLIPVAVEAAPSALARWANYHQATDADEQAVVILDLGYDYSKILICRHGRVLFYKQIDAAGRQINEFLANKLNLGIQDIDEARINILKRETQESEEGDASTAKPGDATIGRTLIDAQRLISTELTREISLCLRYFSVTFRGHRPERAWVTGGLSRDANFLRMIQESSGLKLDAPPMLEEQKLTENQVLACGLAMRLPHHVMQKGQAA
jgi:type IV pilus assembly protein PilM